MEFDDLSMYTEAEIEALEIFRALLSHTLFVWKYEMFVYQPLLLADSLSWSNFTIS